MRRTSNTFATGLLLGLLQWSAFLQVQALVSATAEVHAACLAGWLAGSVAGLSVGRRGPERLWLASALASYYAILLLVRSGLAGASPLAPLALLSGVIGSYAGCFFRRRGDDRSFDAGRLLAQEGAGMAAGIALAAAGIATAGPGFILAGPLAPALLCAATLPRAVRAGDGSDSKI